MKIFKRSMPGGFMGIILLGTVLTASGQKKIAGINVSGEFDNKADGKLTLMYKKLSGGKMEFDSAKVVEGKFNFQKATPEPLIVVIGLEEKKADAGRGGSANYTNLLLNPGEVKMTGSTKLRDMVITGSGTIGNKDYQPYSDELNKYISQTNALNKAVPANLPTEVKELRWQANRDSINLIRDEQVFLKCLKESPEKLISVLALMQYASEPVWRPRKKMEPEIIEKLLATLPAGYQSFPSILALKEELKAAKTTGIGKPIIDFSLLDTAGKTVKLSDYKGKYVFLDFWASWCVPCRKENPNVKKAYAAYKDKGFTVLSVSLDKADARKAWMEAIRNDGIGEWKQVIDVKGFDGMIANQYYVKSIPTNFLIGPDGKFIARNLYGKDLDRELEKLFK